MVGRAKDVTDAVVLDIVEQEVGRHVEYLYLFGVKHMKDLSRVIRREGDERLLRMP